MGQASLGAHGPVPGLTSSYGGDCGGGGTQGLNSSQADAADADMWGCSVSCTPKIQPAMFAVQRHQGVSSGQGMAYAALRLSVTQQ